ncbi:MAG TPA: hypothetical protein VGP25_16025 [Gemmatimonadaceae bacterium]|jgi:hypothetical protein|nr:hypothetical protein [Gemmatimonadaceae bacterium]
MTARLALLPAALLLGALPLRAQSVEYAAGTTRYRVSTTTKGSQSSPMGDSNFEVGMRQQITLSLAKQTKDTMLATITLDSIAMSGAAARADVSSLMGARFVSLVSPTGHVYSTKAPSSANPLLSQIAEGITRYLPAYRANLKTGMAWADTTSGKVTQQGMEVDRTVVSNFTVERDTTIGGAKAFKVARITSVKAAGSGTSQGTPISMESVSTSNGAFFVSSKGVFLGATSNDDVNLKLTILAQGAEISMKQSAQTKIEPIP